MAKKIRLDQFLVNNNYSASIDSAKKEILTGWVSVNGETIRDPRHQISDGVSIKVESPRGNFVSRGGKKLQKAIEFFNLDFKDKNVIDLGASTGGFTDCLLQSGARKVYSVDVGYGQLDYSLRNNPAVVVMERVNARHISSDMFDCPIDFISADISFVSFVKIFSHLITVFNRFEAVALIKPQFEARDSEHIKGVVTDGENQKNILLRVLKELADEGAQFNGLTFSPIKGPKGNIEFLLFYSFDKNSSGSVFDKKIEETIDSVVKEAQEKLNN